MADITTTFGKVLVGSMFILNDVNFFKIHERYVVTSNFTYPKVNAVVIYNVKNPEEIGRLAYIEDDVEVRLF